MERRQQNRSNNTSHNRVLPRPISNAQQVVFLTLDDTKVAAIHISHAKTLQELRMQLEKFSVTIEAEDQFLMKGSRISFEEEATFRIHEVAENSTVAMQSRVRVLSPYTYDLITTTTTLGHHNSPYLTNHLRDAHIWKAIYDTNNLHRGRCFLQSGPQIGTYPLIKLKHQWHPNSLHFDDAHVHVEVSHHQNSKEYLTGKMYNMNAIGKLPFVTLGFGSSHNKRQSSVMNVEEISIFFYYWLPRVIHIFTPGMIEAEPAFINKIDNILDHSLNDDQYNQLRQLFDEYGHGYATKVVLGGHRIHVQQKQLDQTYDEEERKKQVKGIFELACNEVGIGMGLEWSSIRTNTAQQLTSSLTINGCITGGDSLETDINEWCKAFKDPMTWRIIEYQCIEPVYRLLDLERQRKIEVILNKHQEIEQQSAARCRIVPDKLIFDYEEGFYKFSMQPKNCDNSDDCLSSQVNDLFLFFYSPTLDWWYWRRNEHHNTS